MKYRWEFRGRADDETVRRLQQELNDLPEALARTLALRGIDSFDSARAFFRPDTTQLHDPFLMADMHQAVDRILKARRNGEKVMVYGDYDVDGTASVALMSDFLNSIGIETSFFIPHRIEHGYGLCNAGIDTAWSRDASLVVALDCGITAVAQAAYASDCGVDLIICDHHTPPSTLPIASAILNPKRVDCPYPFKELSACGVAFKLVQAVATELDLPPERVDTYLDLVALSVGADIVPVEDENRVLMSLGIDRIRSDARAGIKQLAIVGGLNVKTCSTGQIVFGFAPRINAAGRVDDAAIAAGLLLTDDIKEARTRANLLEELNDRRRSIDHATLEQAVKKAERMFLSRERHGVVLFDESWHPGVIGITASRIVERFYRPAILLTKVNGIAKGSARSVAGLNIYEVLDACSDLLLQFGGHDYAAGMSMAVDVVDEFRERFNEEVGKRMSADMMIPVLRIDSDLDIADISSRFWAVLRQFEPFGPGNARPVYCASGVDVVGKPQTLGKDSSHLKFTVRSRKRGARPFKVIGFDMAGQMPVVRESQESGSGIDLLFSIEENRWNGRTSLELRARDLRVASEAVIGTESADTVSEAIQAYD